MGGLLILTMAALSFLIFTERSAQALTVLGVTLACAAIGFVDDYAKIANKRSLGLAGRCKLALLVPGLGRARLRRAPRGPLDAPVPAADRHAHRPRLGLVRPRLPRARRLDQRGQPHGRARRPGRGHERDRVPGLHGSRDDRLAALAHALRDGQLELPLRRRRAAIRRGSTWRCSPPRMLGCCIGFLWYNSFPAQVFMGDTGSLGLGGALGALAVLTKTELLLPIIAGVFVVEALSVIIQVVSFRRFGRRVFLMAPIHHHFEMKAWSETTIIVRFWIIAALLAGSAFVLAYLRFDQYS